jgi:hypothetical protein
MTSVSRRVPQVEQELHDLLCSPPVFREVSITK